MCRLTFRKRKKKYKGLIKDESLNQRYKLLMAAIRRKARSTCAFMVELEAKSGSGKLCWKQKSQSIRAFKLELKSWRNLSNMFLKIVVMFFGGFITSFWYMLESWNVNLLSVNECQLCLQKSQPWPERSGHVGVSRASCEQGSMLST